MGSSSDEAFCLKWNDFEGSISSSLGSLRQSQLLLDVTLQCGTESLLAHRLVLTACSDWFKSVFRSLGVDKQHPVIVLWETEAADMAMLLDFMYNGEVNVKQESLTGFLALAERLSVRGLTQREGGKGGRKEGEGREAERRGMECPSARRRRTEQTRSVVQVNQEVEEVREVKQEPSREGYGGTEYEGEVTQFQGGTKDYQGETTDYRGGTTDYQEGPIEIDYPVEITEFQGDLPEHQEEYQSYQHNGSHGGGYDSKAFPVHTPSPRPVSNPHRSEYNQPTSLSSPQVANFCTLCGREYANLKQHQDDVHNPHKQPVSCPLCGKVFASKNSMRVHKSTMHRTGDQG